jgi:hypothetical protein
MRSIAITSAGFASGDRTARDMRVWPEGRPGGTPLIHIQELVPGTVLTEAAEIRQLALWLLRVADDLDGR